MLGVGLAVAGVANSNPDSRLWTGVPEPAGRHHGHQSRVLDASNNEILLVDVGPIVAFGRGPIEDCLQLVQISIPDVVLDLLVREVVLSIGGGDDAVRLHYERRLAREPVLQPDLLARHVEGAVAGGATSSCAKPVAVLASSCSRAVPVAAVFLITKTGCGGRGRISDTEHSAKALGLVGFDLPGPGPAARRRYRKDDVGRQGASDLGLRQLTAVLWGVCKKLQARVEALEKPKKPKTRRGESPRER